MDLWAGSSTKTAGKQERGQTKIRVGSVTFLPWMLVLLRKRQLAGRAERPTHPCSGFSSALYFFPQSLVLPFVNARTRPDGLCTNDPSTVPEDFSLGKASGS